MDIQLILTNFTPPITPLSPAWCKICEMDAVFPVPGGPDTYMDPGVWLVRFVMMKEVILDSCLSLQRRVSGRLRWRLFLASMAAVVGSSSSG